LPWSVRGYLVAKGLPVTMEETNLGEKFGIIGSDELSSSAEFGEFGSTSY